MHKRNFKTLNKIQGLCFLLAIMSSCAVTKYKIEKEPLNNFFETNKAFRESHSGLVVFDPAENKTLFAYNSQKHFTPASNTKLLTFYAAEKLAGDSIPALNYALVGDSLFFTGSGDPTFLYTNFDYSGTFDFLNQDNCALVYVEKTIADKRLGPGWAWDDYPYYYSPERASFPIYGNVVRLQKTIDDKKFSIIPVPFGNNVFVNNDSSEFNFTRSEFENMFYLNIPDTLDEIDEAVPFIYSSETFINLLADTLGKPVALMPRMPETSIQTLYSVPTDSVSKYILRDSDNFLAEQMLILISDRLGDTLSSDKTIDYVMENYLYDLKDQIYWVDGSGLSRYNMITPKALSVVLHRLYQEKPKETLFYLLPESSETGTLKKSFPLLEGRIHAKTGSMSHVYNLSGFLETKSGKTLIFSFMNNNFNVSFTELKKEMERVLLVFVNDKK